MSRSDSMSYSHSWMCTPMAGCAVLTGGCPVMMDIMFRQSDFLFRQGCPVHLTSECLVPTVRFLRMSFSDSQIPVDVVFQQSDILFRQSDSCGCPVPMVRRPVPMVRRPVPTVRFLRMSCYDGGCLLMLKALYLFRQFDSWGCPVPTIRCLVPRVGRPVPTIRCPVPRVGRPLPTVGCPVPTVRFLRMSRSDSQIPADVLFRQSDVLFRQLAVLFRESDVLF
jgi:hypothetical protein